MDYSKKRCSIHHHHHPNNHQNQSIMAYRNEASNHLPGTSNCVGCNRLEKELTEKDKVILELQEKLRLIRTLTDPVSEETSSRESSMLISPPTNQRSTSTSPLSLTMKSSIMESNGADLCYSNNNNRSLGGGAVTVTSTSHIRMLAAVAGVAENELAQSPPAAEATQNAVNLKLQDLIDKVIERSPPRDQSGVLRETKDETDNSGNVCLKKLLLDSEEPNLESSDTIIAKENNKAAKQQPTVIVKNPRMSNESPASSESDYEVRNIMNVNVSSSSAAAGAAVLPPKKNKSRPGFGTIPLDKPNKTSKHQNQNLNEIGSIKWHYQTKRLRPYVYPGWGTVRRLPVAPPEYLHKARVYQSADSNSGSGTVEPNEAQNLSYQTYWETNGRVCVVPSYSPAATAAAAPKIPDTILNKIPEGTNVSLCYRNRNN